MQDKLLDYLVCPFCHSALMLLNATRTSDQAGAPAVNIDDGLLICVGCGHPFVIENGIPNMLSSLLPQYEEKMR